MRRSLGPLVAVAVVGVGLAACGEDASNGGDASVEGVLVPDGFAVTEVVTGLARPTQIAFDAEGRLLIAQLAGGEDEGTGQVLRLDLETPNEREVLADGLLTPTGVTEANGEVWVMEQRRLGRINADGSIEVELDDLPFNGRSEGTLSTTAEGAVLYNTSGTLDGIDAAEGSGTIWSITADTEPVAIASGLKHGYARVVDDEGRLWSVEMSDGSYDGEPAPDEVMLVEPGDDFGWPRCIGDGIPVDFYGGTDADCAGTPPSLTLFEPGATPTSIAVAPWDPDLLVVALWNRGEVVTVSIDEPNPDQPVVAEVFLTGVEHPQHVLADGDRLLLVDHDGGRILAIEPTD